MVKSILGFVVPLIYGLVFLSCIHARRQSNVISPEAKLGQITELAARSRGNVVHLDDSTYNYYAINRPRPYSLVVFFTASHPKFKCTVCQQVEMEFYITALSYLLSLQATRLPATIFFLRLDYEASSKVFQSYQVNSVPFIFHLSRNLVDIPYGLEYKIDTRDKFQINMDPTAETLALFIKSRSGVAIEIRRTLLWLYILLIVLVGLVLFLIRPIIRSLPFLLAILQKRALWAVLSIVVYLCSISGLVFDILRMPPMYYTSQNRHIKFFNPQAGSQFVIEGFIIGFLNLFCSVALIVLVAFVPRIKKENSRRVWLIVCLVVFTLSFLQIQSTYNWKNRWYD